MCGVGNDCREYFSSVYQLIVLREDGEILVRGGRHFTKFQRVVFLGSISDGSPLEPRTIDIGLRMTFMAGDRVIITSPVQSLCRRRAVRDRVCDGPVIRTSSA